MRSMNECLPLLLRLFLRFVPPLLFTSCSFNCLMPYHVLYKKNANRIIVTYLLLLSNDTLFLKDQPFLF
jgi:hypothetical protein